MGEDVGGPSEETGSEGGPVAAPRVGLMCAAGRGAVAGLRRISYPMVPITILAMIPGLALSALGLGSGRGWPFVPRTIVPAILYNPIVFYLACVLIGLGSGGVLGVIRAAILRARPGFVDGPRVGAGQSPDRTTA